MKRRNLVRTIIAAFGAIVSLSVTTADKKPLQEIADALVVLKGAIEASGDTKEDFVLQLFTSKLPNRNGYKYTLCVTNNNDGALWTSWIT